MRRLCLEESSATGSTEKPCKQIESHPVADLTPEQRAREQIDAQLIASGWVVQNFKAVDFTAGRGIALREVPLKTGPCVYLLLVDRVPVGVVEAKKPVATLS